MDKFASPAVIAIGIITAVTTSVWATWCTWIAFVGGTLPLLGWHMDGNLLVGLLFIFFVEPLLLTAGYWAGIVLALPFLLLLGRD
jgi:hypothetical protein